MLSRFLCDQVKEKNSQTDYFKNSAGANQNFHILANSMHYNTINEIMHASSLVLKIRNVKESSNKNQHLEVKH